MVVFDKPHALCDVPMHYCPGCSHGTVHKLVAEVIEEMGNYYNVSIEDITAASSSSKISSLFKLVFVLCVL